MSSMFASLRERFETMLDEVARDLRCPRPARVRRVSGKYYPKAISCDLHAMQLETVTGVAIVGCTVKRSLADQEAEMAAVLDTLAVLEPVAPLRARGSPLSPPDTYLSCEYVSSPVVPAPSSMTDETWSLAGPGSPYSPTCAAGSLRELGPNAPLLTFFTTTRDSSLPPLPEADPHDDAEWPGDEEGEDAPLARNLFNRGYILFTDAADVHLCDTALATVIHAHRAAVTAPEPAMPTAAGRSRWRQRNTEVRHYLSLGETEHRPLFRRRSSELVYGRAAYVTAQE